MRSDGTERWSGSGAAGTPAIDWRHLGDPRGEARHRFVALITIAAMLGLLLLIAYPRPVVSQGVALLKVDVAVLGKGWRASKLIGSIVTNDKNEKIGTLDDLVVDQKTVLFAVLQVGGFLGVGAHVVAVPYDSLKIDEAGAKVELPGATKEELKKLGDFKYRGT